MKPKLKINVVPKVFQRILRGEQDEFYREENTFYERIFNEKGQVQINGKWYYANEILLLFYCGHRRTYREWLFECKSLRVGQGRKKWGGFDQWSYIIDIGNRMN